MKQLFLASLFFTIIFIVGVHAETNYSQISTKNISLPPVLNDLFSFIFHLPEGQQADLSDFIVLIALWFIIFLIIGNLFDLFNIFPEGIKRKAMAILFTFILSYFSVLSSISFVFFWIGEMLGKLTNLGAFNLIFTISCVIIATFIIFRLLKRIKRAQKKGKARDEGFAIGVDSSVKGVAKSNNDLRSRKLS